MDSSALSEQLREEGLAAWAPHPSSGSSAPRQHSSQHGQRGLGDGEWEPLFVPTEKVLTSFLCHLHGNRRRR